MLVLYVVGSIVLMVRGNDGFIVSASEIHKNNLGALYLSLVKLNILTISSDNKMFDFCNLGMNQC